MSLGFGPIASAPIGGQSSGGAVPASIGIEWTNDTTLATTHEPGVEPGVGGGGGGPTPPPSSAYPAPLFAVPASNPSLQTGMEPFAPVLSGSTPDVSAPILSRITQRAKAARIVRVSGHQFDDIQLVIYGEGDNGSSGFLTCVRQQTNGNLADFLLPPTVPARALILAWPKTVNGGVGYPLAINAPEIFTLNADTWGGPSCEAGATAYIGGINLCNDDTIPQAWIYIQPSVGTGQFVTPASIARGLLTFTVPALALGTYEVWVHNGRGGQYGWHKSRIDLVVTNPAFYDRDFSTSVDLATYTAIYGGGPDSGVSVHTAWDAAMAALGAISSGGTINVAAGNFVTSAQLNTIGGNGKSIRVQGAGKDVTFFRPLSGFADSIGNGGGMFISQSAANELCGLTVDVTNGLGSFSARVLNETSLRDVKVNAYNRSSLVLVHCSYVDGYILDGCDLWGGADNDTVVGWNVLQNGLIRNCTFRMANTPETCMWPFFVTLNTTVINTSAADYTPGSVTGRGRLFNSGYTTVGLTINNCTTDELHVGGGDQNKGEQINLSDGGIFAFSDQASAGTATTVTVLSTGNDNLNNYFLFVAGGKGVGQFAKIIGPAASGVLTLDRSFTVYTDSTSLIYFVQGSMDVSISECDLSGDGQNTSASAGMESFAASAGIHFFTNSVSGVNFGYVDLSLHSGSGNCPAIWNWFGDNAIDDCNYAMRLQGAGTATGQEIELSLSVHVDETFTNLKVKDVLFATNPDSDIVLDHLTITGNGVAGLYFGPNCAGGKVLLSGNNIALGSGTFSGSKDVWEDPAAIPLTVTLVNSGQFSGFETPYVPPPPPDLNRGVVSVFHCNETSGNLVDAFGSNTATDNNGVGSAAGKIAGGRDFEKSSLQYFSKTSPTGIDNQNVSVAFWIKPESIADYDVPFMYATTDAWTNGYGFYFFSNQLRWFAQDSGTNIRTGTLSAGAWSHVVGTYNATSNKLSVYFNGVLSEVLINDVTITFSGAVLEIGRGRNDVAVVDGVVDEIMIYNRELSIVEVAMLYDANVAGNVFPFS